MAPKKGRKQADHTGWTTRVMTTAGASDEQVCGHCDGTGRIPRRWSVADVVAVLLPDRTRGLSGGQLAEVLEDPKLSDLHAIAVFISEGTDTTASLEDAAAWARDLAADIRRALEG